VEERPVLVVGECVVDLLIPQNTSVGGRNVHELDEVGVAHEIIGEDRSALQTGVGPSVAVVRVSNVELRNGDSVDLVGSLRYGTLDSLLVVVREDGRHGGGVECLVGYRLLDYPRCVCVLCRSRAPVTCGLAQTRRGEIIIAVLPESGSLTKGSAMCCMSV
jgi:hypothetical protein